MTARFIAADDLRNLAKTISKTLSCLPNGLIAIPQKIRKLINVVLCKNDPIGPLPLLIWPSYINIKDDPVQPTWPYIWVSQPVFLPGMRDRDVTRF